jgi:uncharacterized protein (TIRG00374 family)
MKLEKNQQETFNSDGDKDANYFLNKKYEQICLTDKSNELDQNDSYKKEKKYKKIEQLEISNEKNSEENEKLEEAEEVVKKQSSKKKKWLSLIFVLINVGVVAGVLTYQLLSESFTSIEDISKKINWWIILLTIFVFVVINFSESLKIWILTYSATGKSRASLSYKVSSIGRYYDDITPFGTGGQPFQIYYLSKHGISGAESWSIPMGRYVTWQISFVSFSLIIMIFSISLNNFANAGTAVVTAGSWIGFAANAALLLLVGIISISKKAGTKLISGILKVLNKMKILKNYESRYQKVMDVVDNYQSTMRKYAKNKWSFISLILLNYLTFILHYSLPFFIYAAFYGFDITILTTIITYCAMIDLASSFLPLPGGTGAAELSFAALFGLFFAGGDIFWAMIIWRIFTFYGYILQGLGIIIYDYLIGNKRFEWEKKKWHLEAESREFEENHLKEFEISLQKSKIKNKKRR